jgi:hypothetical protein
MGELLGTGSAGAVWSASFKSDKRRTVAIKEMSKRESYWMSSQVWLAAGIFSSSTQPPYSLLKLPSQNQARGTDVFSSSTQPPSQPSCACPTG